MKVSYVAKAGFFTAAAGIVLSAFATGIRYDNTAVDARTIGLTLIFGSVSVTAVLFSITMTILSKKAKAVHKRRQADSDRANYERALAEAAEVEKRANALLESSYIEAESIPIELEHACDALARAQNEFVETAYGPFWDEAECAAELLAEATGKLRSIARSAQEYGTLLAEWRHNFPRYPVSIDALPDLAATAAAVQLVVRRGHTKYEFASIWEHRKGRKVYVGDFRSIGEAIADGATAVTEAFDEFSRSVPGSLDTTDVRMSDVARHSARVSELQQQLLKQLQGSKPG